MKKNEKRKLWKQGLGTALVCGLAVAVFPAAKADAADLLKAGPINTTAEHVTQNQPFAERTAGSQYFRIPAFIVTQKGNLLAAADARYSTTGDGGGLEGVPRCRRAAVSREPRRAQPQTGRRLARQCAGTGQRRARGPAGAEVAEHYCRCGPDRRFCARDLSLIHI